MVPVGHESEESGAAAEPPQRTLDRRGSHTHTSTHTPHTHQSADGRCPIPGFISHKKTNKTSSHYGMIYAVTSELLTKFVSRTICDSISAAPCSGSFTGRLRLDRQRVCGGSGEVSFSLLISFAPKSKDQYPGSAGAGTRRYFLFKCANRDVE